MVAAIELTDFLKFAVQVLLFTCAIKQMAALGFDVSDQGDLEVTYSSDDADFSTVNSDGKALIL